jgi:hypothetical protein
VVRTWELLAAWLPRFLVLTVVACGPVMAGVGAQAYPLDQASASNAVFLSTERAHGTAAATANDDGGCFDVAADASRGSAVLDDLAGIVRSAGPATQVADSLTTTAGCGAALPGSGSKPAADESVALGLRITDVCVRRT